MVTKPGVPERRKQSRMALRIPVRVTGHETNGTPWTEMSVTENADLGGAAFHLKHRVTRGHALLLSLPMPKIFRSYDLSAASYSIYAVVRNTLALPEGTLRVGVMFLGRHPPRGFAQNPGGLYLLPNDVVTGSRASGRSDGVVERRAHPRYDLALRLRLIRPEPVLFGPASESTVTRNLSAGGAMVTTSLPLSRGDIVLVEDLQGILRTRAEVRGLFIGKDNLPRLNLRFLDPEAVEAVRALLRQNAIFE
jgi:hypothetical protein